MRETHEIPLTDADAQANGPEEGAEPVPPALDPGPLQQLVLPISAEHYPCRAMSRLHDLVHRFDMEVHFLYSQNRTGTRAMKRTAEYILTDHQLDQMEKALNEIDEKTCQQNLFRAEEEIFDADVRYDKTVLRKLTFRNVRREIGRSRGKVLIWEDELRPMVRSRLLRESAIPLWLERTGEDIASITLVLSDETRVSRLPEIARLLATSYEAELTVIYFIGPSPEAEKHKVRARRLFSSLKKKLGPDVDAHIMTDPMDTVLQIPRVRDSDLMIIGRTRGAASRAARFDHTHEISLAFRKNVLVI